MWTSAVSSLAPSVLTGAGIRLGSKAVDVFADARKKVQDSIVDRFVDQNTNDASETSEDASSSSSSSSSDLQTSAPKNASSSTEQFERSDKPMRKSKKGADDNDSIHVSPQVCEAHGFWPEAINVRDPSFKDPVRRAKERGVRLTLVYSRAQKGFQGLTGMINEKEVLEKMFIYRIKYPNSFAPEGEDEQKTPKGILFFGPPGTGKTQLARAFAQQLALEFQLEGVKEPAVTLTLADGGKIKNKMQGESEKRVTEMYECAQMSAEQRKSRTLQELQAKHERLYARDPRRESEQEQEEEQEEQEEENKKRKPFVPPKFFIASVLFIDEFESLVQDRNKMSMSGPDSFGIITQFLQKSTDPKYQEHIIQIAATNIPTSVDTAILRRFPIRVFIDYPSDQDRFEFFRQKFFYCFQGYLERLSQKHPHLTLQELRTRSPTLFELCRGFGSVNAFGRSAFFVNTQAKKSYSVTYGTLDSRSKFSIWEWPAWNKETAAQAPQEYMQYFVKRIDQWYNAQQQPLAAHMILFRRFWWICVWLTLLTGASSQGIASVSQQLKNANISLEVEFKHKYTKLPSISPTVLLRNFGQTMNSTIKDKEARLTKHMEGKYPHDTPDLRKKRVRAYLRKKMDDLESSVLQEWTQQPKLWGALSEFGHSFSDLANLFQNAINRKSGIKRKESGQMEEWKPKHVRFVHFLEAAEQFLPTKEPVESYTNMYLYSKGMEPI